MIETVPSARPRVRFWCKALLLVTAITTGTAAIALIDAWRPLGTTPDAARLERFQKSLNYRENRFQDSIPRAEPDIWVASARWLRGVEHSRPEQPLPVAFRQLEDFLGRPPSGLSITWFGHSSLLVQIEGRTVLIDPVWGDRCSPSHFVGPKRFHPVPIALQALPPPQVVLISHDHYDHLEYASIRELDKSHPIFVVPLGVGAHLEYWGVDPKRIRELDWWQETQLFGLTLVCTPARHFSGRGLGKDVTLWSGWAIIGPARRVYYSGDTAMFEGFESIGQRLGPFDATLIEVGAYDALWADVHLGPEQAVEAHRQVRGAVMLPVHWGTFDLALHSWVEPIERAVIAAKRKGVTLVTPRPGESVDPLGPPRRERWWPSVPWKRAAEAPVVSSGLGQGSESAGE